MAWKLEYYAVTLVQRIRLDERTVVTFENLSWSLDAMVKRDQVDHAPTDLAPDQSARRPHASRAGACDDSASARIRRLCS